MRTIIRPAMTGLAILATSTWLGGAASSAPVACIGEDGCTVSDGNARIHLDLINNDAIPNVNFFDLDGFFIGEANNIFTHGLFLRINGSVEEPGTPPITQLSATQDADLGQIVVKYGRDLDGNAGDDLFIDVVLTLTSVSDAFAILDESITFTSTVDVSFDLFQYWDFDLGEVFDDDSASSSLDALRQFDATNSIKIVPSGGLAPIGHETRICGLGANCSLLDSILGGSDLNDQGGPIVGEDLTMAFQFSGGLNEGNRRTLSIATSSALVEVPAPAPLALLGLGLVGLGLARRMKRA